MDLEVVRFVNENSNAVAFLEIMRDVGTRRSLLNSDEKRELKFRLHVLGLSEEMTLALFHYILAMNAVMGWVTRVWPLV